MILQKLSKALGVSGDEGRVREIISESLEDHVDEIWNDQIGNLYALKRGIGAHSLRVLLNAHMDEVGLMITNIDDDGSLHFKAIGGLERVILGKVVLIGSEKLPGVIGGKPVQLMERKKDETIPMMDSLRIDIGAIDKETATKKVKIGDRAVFATSFVDLGPTMMGKAFDDRVGCAVLIELLKSGPYPVDIVAAFTVQEETEERGAKVVGYRLEPDLAFVIESAICDDLPKKKDVSPISELGRGPALPIMVRSTIADPRLIRFFKSVAAKHNIPYQIYRTTSGGGDSGPINVSLEGIPVADIAVPCRYIHGPAAICNKDDYKNTIRLVGAALKCLTPALITR